MSQGPALASRLDAVKPSATVAISDRARQLKAEGHDVLSFSVGEPDFDTPVHVREAAKQAIDAGLATRYTAAKGIPELLDAILERSVARRGDHGHGRDNVIVSVGAKHTLFNLAVCLFEPGDEILVPAPHWVSYPEQANLVGAKPVSVLATAEEGFRLTPDRLRAAITPKTKALILCSPSNPTGSAYTAEQLEGLAAVAREHDFWIIADEIYGELVYGGFEQKSILEVAPDLKDRILIVDGVSKTYAMTGWRIGWLTGPAHVVKACNKVQGQGTTNPAAVAQHAAIAALRGPESAVEEMRAAFEKRRALIVEGLNALDGVTCRTPEGAFYGFPSVEGLLGRTTKDGKKLETDLDVCAYLLDEAKCALVPGTAFGAPGFARMSYATSEANIQEGLRRIGEAIAALS